jgi:hypothetical protein
MPPCPSRKSLLASFKPMLPRMGRPGRQLDFENEMATTIAIPIRNGTTTGAFIVGPCIEHSRRFLSDRSSRNANDLLGSLNPSHRRPSHSKKVINNTDGPNGTARARATLAGGKRGPDDHQHDQDVDDHIGASVRSVLSKRNRFMLS